MKIKPTANAGQVVVQLDWQDEHLLEESARQSAAASFQIRRILVPIDFSASSRRTLQAALPFARQFGAKIALVHVIEPMLLPENLMLAVPELPAIGNDLMADSQKRLEQLAVQEIPAEHRLPTQVRVGRPFDEIIRVADENQVDLIVISTHGYTGLKHVLMGSTAERVVRHASCPVLTLRSAPPEAAADE